MRTLNAYTIVVNTRKKTYTGKPNRRGQSRILKSVSRSWAEAADDR